MIALARYINGSHSFKYRNLTAGTDKCSNCSVQESCIFWETSSCCWRDRCLLNWLLIAEWHSVHAEVTHLCPLRHSAALSSGRDWGKNRDIDKSELTDWHSHQWQCHFPERSFHT